MATHNADPFDALDQVVEGFGRTVGNPGRVAVVAQLVESGPNGASELLDLRRHGAFETVALEVFEPCPGLVGIARTVEVA